MAELGAGAVLGIKQFSVQLTGLSMKSYRAYQRARNELDYFCTSVSTSSVTLNLFCQSMKGAIDQVIGLGKDSQTIGLLEQLSRAVEDRMGKIHQGFIRLRALGHPKASTISHLQTRVMWVIVDEREMKELLASLEPIKSTMNLLVNLSLMMEYRKSCEARIKMLKGEAEEKQRQYEALRTVSTSDVNNTFYEETMRPQLVREIVERVHVLATDRVSASRVIMKEVEREQTSSTRTRDKLRRSVARGAQLILLQTHPPSFSRPEQPGQGMDRSRPRPITRESGQVIDHTAELFRSPGDETRQT
ncbi:uncharacterized protein A1O9_10452 [Exophiala aquamarina CBS 119918]|uniref:Fungal N-terminal domain-containing protein n=1 Tax=Exophiala aquamarina CBS 119918 TaxID=1182545 RepID=A0A072P1C4_9EURO|nr:uncharacterized protein A1O9_10452 [Exophiala aquamarina CBS 119918]KEF53477.1 hypothetical protein A1O9_10452 [Exophiala aquamarina CBS 119918]